MNLQDIQMTNEHAYQQSSVAESYYFDRKISNPIPAPPCDDCENRALCAVKALSCDAYTNYIKKGASDACKPGRPSRQPSKGAFYDMTIALENKEDEAVILSKIDLMRKARIKAYQKFKGAKVQKNIVHFKRQYEELRSYCKNLQNQLSNYEDERKLNRQEVNHGLIQ